MTSQTFKHHVMAVVLFFMAASINAQESSMRTLIDQSLSKLQQPTTEAYLNCIAELKRIDEMFPDSVYTVNYFLSDDGNCYTALMGVTHHAHEIRPFTNRYAYQFAKQFRRKDGKIVIE